VSFQRSAQTLLALRTFGGARFWRLAREGGWVVTGQVASVAGALVLVRVLTGRLEPHQYGELALALTLAGLVGQLIIGGATAGIGRFYSIAAEANEVRRYAGASARVMLHSTAAVGGLAALVIGGLILTGRQQWLGLTIAVFVFSVVSGFNSAMGSIQNAARQRVIVAMHSGLDAWLRIALIVVLMVWVGATSTAVVIGYSVSALLVTGSQVYFLHRLLRPQLGLEDHSATTDWSTPIWSFSWPIMAAGFFNWGYYASQRWALQFFAASDEVGRFYALTQIAYSPVSLAGAAFMALIVPILYARAGDPANIDRVMSTRLVVGRLSVIGLCAVLLLAGTTALFHESIFRIFVAPEYRDLSRYMPLAVAAAGILVVSHTLGTSVLITNRTRLLLPLAVVGNSVVAIGNLYATSQWGIRGLMGSMVLGAMLHLAWVARIVTRNS
jgi:O-antigen/teichoic acid export membrane protein